MPEFPAVAVLLDSLERVEDPLSNDGKWSELPLAGIAAIGKCYSTTFGWVGSLAGHCGAYWNPNTYKAPALYVRVAQEPRKGLWVALWACQTGENGYRLRLESRSETESDKWRLLLEKCVAGKFTVLGEHAVVGKEAAARTTFGLTVKEGKVKAWWKPAAEWEVALEVADATYNEGHIGMETSGAPNLFGQTQLNVGAQEAGSHEHTLTVGQAQRLRTFIGGVDIFGAPTELPMVL